MIWGWWVYLFAMHVRQLPQRRRQTESIAAKLQGQQHRADHAAKSSQLEADSSLFPLDAPGCASAVVVLSWSPPPLRVRGDLPLDGCVLASDAKPCIVTGHPSASAVMHVVVEEMLQSILCQLAMAPDTTRECRECRCVYCRGAHRCMRLSHAWCPPHTAPPL